MGDSFEWRPLLVLVTGAPGSGKTTLARQLAAELRLPHLNRDEVFDGLRHSVARGAPAPVAQRGVPLWFSTLEHLLAGGVSMVADGTMYRGEFEGDVRRLHHFAQVVNVHCRTADPTTRFRARQLARGASAAELDAQLAKVADNLARAVDPLDPSKEVIEVATDGIYEPSLESLVTRLTAPARRSRR